MRIPVHIPVVAYLRDFNIRLAWYQMYQAWHLFEHTMVVKNLTPSIHLNLSRIGNFVDLHLVTRALLPLMFDRFASGTAAS